MQVRARIADILLVNDMGTNRQAECIAGAAIGEPVELRLQSLTYEDRDPVLAELSHAIDLAGGWILERRSVSAHTVEFRIELQTRVLVEMYAAMVGSGIELTRAAHWKIAERCTCIQHLRSRESLGAILAIRLEVSFLGDLPQSSGWLDTMLQQAATA